jgi:4-amino-4-deoxy-L-arabinose transferase-like glycosyltransferase
MKDIVWLWILFFAAFFLYTFNLGELPLRDWDEGIVATVAREIWRANLSNYTWLYPQNIDGSPYWNKPPLIHDLIALSYYFFGVSEWSTRLIVSIISALCIPLLYLIGLEVFATRKEAFISALIYLTLIPVVRHNRLAMLDGAVTFEFCFAIWCLLKIYRYLHQSPVTNQPKYLQFYILGVGFSCGLLCLTKGIAIAVLFSLLSLSFIITEKKVFISLFSWQNILIVLLGLSPAIAWYGLQYIHYGREFISYNLGTQTFNRVINTVEDNDRPIWYYCLELSKYSLPWLIFLPGGIKLAIQQWDQIWAKLSLIWFGIYFFAISLMTTKLPWYIIPLYPAVALLVGAKLNQIRELQTRGKFQQNIYQISFIFLAILFWLATIYYVFLLHPQDTDLIEIAVILALTFTVTTNLIIQKSNYFIVTLIIGLYLALLTLFNSPHAIWELAEAYPVKPVAKLIKDLTPAKTTIYTSYPYYRPSLNFYSDRLIIPVSETKLQEILLNQKKVYLLIPSNTPTIPNSKVIGATEAWRMVVTGNR